jgi:hypothetical protein
MAETQTLPPLAITEPVIQNQHRAQPLQDTLAAESHASWSSLQRISFRFFFAYFFLQAVPLDWKYYRDLFSLDWTGLPFSTIFYAARYAPRFFGDAYQFADWVVIAAIAVAATAAWTYLDRKRTEYNDLYYWLRVLLRYRLAAALLAYGFIKFFPMQMPYPSLSSLSTSYGDITHWKVFSLSTGIVPGYQSFLGLVEIVAALLLLNRKTTIIGIFIILPFLGNVLMSNLAYEGAEYVYSLLLITFGLALFAFDAQRLLNLTTFERTTLPNRYKPVFGTPAQRSGRLALKGFFIVLFTLVYGNRTYAAYHAGGYQYPATKPLYHAAGLYTVQEFKVNGTIVPPDGRHASRWKDVVFENWGTLSIRSNEKATLTTANTEEVFSDNDLRLYEYAGTAGRTYYHYTVDSVAQKLVLTAANDKKSAPITLHYARPAADRIILTGLVKTDSLSVTLDRLNKKYLLHEASKAGRRKGLKL